MSDVLDVAAVRAAIHSHPELNDRQLARLLKIRAYTKVQAVRQQLEAELAEQPLAPAALTLAPTIVCENCGREGTPHLACPTWCKACQAGGAEARANWGPPALSSGSKLALELLAEFGHTDAGSSLRCDLLRARARDWNILEVR